MQSEPIVCRTSEPDCPNCPHGQTFSIRTDTHIGLFDARITTTATCLTCNHSQTRGDTQPERPSPWHRFTNRIASIPTHRHDAAPVRPPAIAFNPALLHIF